MRESLTGKQRDVVHLSYFTSKYLSFAFGSSNKHHLHAPYIYIYIYIYTHTHKRANFGLDNQ